MKRKKTQGLEFWYKLAKGLATVALLLWLLETAYFLIVDGWHWRAVNPLEVWADNIVTALFGGVGFSLIMCGLDLIEFEIKARANQQRIMGCVSGEAIQAALGNQGVISDGEIKEVLTSECLKPCGMNYCDDNGCINRKRNLVEPYNSGIGWQDAPTAPKP